MTFGNVLDEAWTLYTKHFVRLFLIAFAVYVVLNLVSALLGVTLDDDTLGWLLFVILNAAISVIGYFWVQGALVEATADIRDGKQDLAFGETFSRVRPLLAALIVAGLLAGLGILVGLILLVVPGLYLLTRWALIAPVIVLEKRSAGDSFGRSHELVRGHGWTIFGLIVVVALLSAIVGGIISGILQAALNDFLGFWIGNTVANAIVTPFFAVALTVAYLQLTRAGDTEAAV